LAIAVTGMCVHQSVSSRQRQVHAFVLKVVAFAVLAERSATVLVSR
jgi:hypothetical protein